MNFEWTAPDGTVFPCEEWRPGAEVSGTVICVHGLGGATSDFTPLGEAVSKAGLACCALNLRGQGKDPQKSRRGTFLDLEILGHDIASFAETMRKLSPAAPVFLCGESMGALIVSWLLAENCLSGPVNGAIFSAPVVELRKPTPWLVREMVRLGAFLLPGWRFTPSLFVSGSSGPLRVTRDESHAERVRQASHYLRAFSFRFYHSLGRLMESSHQLAARIQVPCLVLAAGQDVYLSPEQIRRWFDKIGAADKTFRLHPESYHLLWNDWDKEEVLRGVVEWLYAHGAGKALETPGSAALAKLNR